MKCEIVRQQDDVLFCGDMRIKSGRQACHSFNEEILEEIRQLTSDIEILLRKLSDAKQIVLKVVKKKTRRTENQKNERKQMENQEKGKRKSS